MQSNWQYKLYHQEAAPPQGAWAGIASVLDTDDKITNIYQQEETPPAGVWEAIASALDDNEAKEDWQHTIYNQTAIPPEGVWESISTHLDKAAVSNVPAAVPVRRLSIIRMAAAAVITGLLATGVWFLTQPAAKAPVDVAATPSKPAAPATTVAPAPIPVFDSMSPISQSVPIATAKATVAQSRVAPQRSITIQPLSFLPESKAVGTDETTIPAMALENRALLDNPAGNAIDNMDNTVSVVNSGYISISGPDGQTVRLSSKFSNLAAYLNDESPDTEELLDRIIRESAFWKAKFRRWREKMLNNTTAPSFGNFMDMIELGKLLEEKQ
jgi:hypothetical protein